MANLATKASVEGEEKLSIHTPLINLTKAEIIQKGISFNIDYSLTSSCYDPSPEGEPCYQCDSCQLRVKGFSEVGIDDPLIKSDELLKIAKENIDKNFILIGTTEQFDESILLLKGLLNWNSPYYSRANRTRNKPDYNKIDAEIRNFIKEHNQLDIDLYNYVKKVINNKINEAGKEFINDLNHFKRINSIINPIFGFSRLKRFLSKLFK